MARYDEPQRRYHTRQHLREMLAALGTLGVELALGDEDLSTARLALWFHDAVYDVHAPSSANERSSAALAVGVLGALGVDVERASAVERLILATADHRSPEADKAGAAEVLLDADLWILASPRARFDEYCEQVRAEYGFVDDATYAAARSAILQDLLERPRIYATEPAHRAWTASARANLARELDRLG